MVDDMAVMTSTSTSLAHEACAKLEIGAWWHVQRIRQLVESLSGAWGRVGTYKVLILVALCRLVYDL